MKVISGYRRIAGDDIIRDVVGTLTDNERVGKPQSLNVKKQTENQKNNDMRTLVAEDVWSSRVIT